MSDYTELQKAAAYAAQDTIKFADEDEEMRALQQFHEEVDPETILALIADLDEARNGIKHSCAIRLKKEIERLKAELDCPFRLARHSKRLVEQLRAQAEQYDQALIKMAAERDQLRAEVAGLRTGYEAYERVNAELKAEVEKLRKERDARHPFKPFHEPSIGYTGCVICGVYTDHGGLPCPKTRATADAALGQVEQS